MKESKLPPGGSTASRLFASNILATDNINKEKKSSWTNEEMNLKKKKEGGTDLNRIFLDGGHQVDDGSSNNDLSIQQEED